MTLIASWGGQGSNSYIDLTAANSFIASSIIDNALWTAATTAQKTAALLTATSQIDGCGTYIYGRKYSDQTLEFPRGLTSSWQTLNVVSDGSLSYLEQRMQKDVERATCVQAVYLLQQFVQSEHQKMIEAGIEEVEREVGPIRERFSYGSAQGVSGFGTSRSRLCKDASDYLSNWTTTRAVVRG